MRRVMRSLATNGFLEPGSDYSTFTNKDDFIKDCSGFLDFWINRTIGSNKEVLFNIDLFCSGMQIERAKYLALPTLTVAVLQTMEDWRQELSSINALHISLRATNGNFYTYDMEIDDSESIVTIFKNIANSALNAESCLDDTSLLLMSFNHVSKASTLISLIREKDSTYFKIATKINSCCSNSIKQKIFSDVFYSIVSIPKDQQHQNSLNCDNKVKSNDGSKLDKSTEYAQMGKKSHQFIRCVRCQASLSDLNQERGLDAYLLPIIRSDNKKSYICDLCASGW